MPKQPVESHPFRTTIAIWLLVLSTLAFVPGGFVHFVFPKLFIATIALGIGAMAARSGHLPRTVSIVTTAAFAVFLFAALTSTTPIASLVGRWPRYEGLPTLVVYAGALWLGSRLLGGRGRLRHTATLFNATATMSVILAAFSAFDAAGKSPFGPSAAERTGSLLGNATDQGIVAMIAIALLLRPAIATRSWLYAFGLAAGLVTVALSGSRAVIGVTALVIIVQIVMSRGEVRRFAVPGLGVLVVLVAVLPQARDRFLHTQTITGRSLLWQESWDLGVDHWLHGVGPSRFVDAIGAYHDSEWVTRVGAANPPDSAHNWLLQAVVVGGLPLLIVGLVFSALVLHLGWRAVRSRTDQDYLALGAFTAVAGYGLVLLTYFTVAGTACLAAFLLGALVSEDVAKQAERSWNRAAAVGLATVLAVIMLGSSLAEIALQRGITAAAEGRTNDADHAFSTASHLRPLDGDVAMLAAQAFAGRASKGDADASLLAEHWARRSLERTPQSFASGLALAVAELGRNDPAATKAVLDPLISRFPTEPQAYTQRGIANFGLKDVAAARKDLGRAIELDPDDPTAQRVLDAIEDRLGS